MENIREVLSNLKKARTLLEATYCQWLQNTVDGKHCSLGAIGNIKRYSSYRDQLLFSYIRHVDPEALALSETAISIHPELVGCIAVRLDTTREAFDYSPIVYVNNHLGKEETLRIWDLTIAELELRVASLDTVLSTDKNTEEEYAHSH